MDVVTMHQAKSSLSQLVQKAKAGEEVYIGAFGKAEAKIVAVNYESKPVKRLGLMAGEIRISPDFDNALPADIQSEFE